MRTWVLASPIGFPGTVQYRIPPGDFCEPGTLKVQQFPTSSQHCIQLRSGRKFLFPLSYCSRGILRRKMLSTGEMAEKALGGRSYVGGLHKQVLDITHRSLLPCGGKETGHVTVCFKDDDYQNGSTVVNSVTCTTYNILAPIYKRINGEGIRESEYREYWFSRNKSILEVLLQKRSSVICLQEFWIKNEELADMYEKRLNDAGYDIYKLGRTNDRGDGIQDLRVLGDI